MWQTAGVTSQQPSRIGVRRAAARAKAGAAYSDRRPEIIRAAAMLFKTQGVARTTLKEIAEAIGSDRATLYYYFSGKDEIFDAIVDEGLGRSIAILEEVRDMDADAPTKMRRMIVDLMVSFEELYPYLYVYVQDHLDHVAPERKEWADRMRSMNRRGERAVEAIIRQGIDEGTFEPLSSPRVLSFGAFGMVNWTNRWFVPGESPATAQEIGEAYAEIFVRGLMSRS